MGLYKTSLSLIAGVAMALGATAAFAQDFPRKPVAIVVPYSAGGGIDTIARAVADAASDTVPVPITVANVGGSGGLNGAQTVKSARPDGYTVMLTSGGALILSTMTRDTDIDPFADFTYIGQVGLLRSAVIVPASSPYETAEQLVEAIRSQPDSLRWAHSGRGGSFHVAGLSFLDKNGLAAQDVPFKGGAKARTALLGSQVDFGIIGIQQADGFDDLRVLAVTSAQRDPVHPDVPTLAELGIGSADVSSPVVMMAPAGTPVEAVAYLQSVLEGVTAKDGFAEVMKSRGLAPVFADANGAEAALSGLKKDAEPLLNSLSN
ncbi:Bug family tripartite tricarboxylate transporter substrate binding protein [Loktanella sp. Alg231-35]|uniref:Bug family tripartite tricarboxylate transporter substrate binding protein n=1 Tax=Loktanella sp. Alg231-35 TaxID=1922220 RepID=UPI000D5619A4|nr:tripartite tricarboxylate transporter substrate binding protein [Loktanella sp. Alg231-35]